MALVLSVVKQPFQQLETLFPTYASRRHRAAGIAPRGLLAYVAASDLISAATRSCGLGGRPSTEIARLLVQLRLWLIKFRQTARHSARTPADHTLGHTWVPRRPCSSVQPEACSYRYPPHSRLGGYRT